MGQPFTSRASERAGYAFGKHGADILLPGMIAKTVSRTAAGGQEVVAAYRSLQAAEQTLALEAIARSGASGQELAEMAAKLAKGERPGIASKGIAGVKTPEELMTNGAKAMSMETFSKAETLLRPYKGQHLPEVQARELIHQAGIKTFPKPQGIPDNFRV